MDKLRYFELVANRLKISGNTTISLVITLALALIFTVDSAHAQNSNNDDLLACDAIEDQRDKLKCFNDIVNRLRSQMDGPSLVSPRAGHDDGMAGVSEQKNSVTSAMGSAANEKTPGTAPDERDNFGFPNLDNNKFTLVMGVNRFWYSYDKKLVLELTNGQIWMETKSSSYRNRPRERAVDPHTLTVEIEEGRVGGYRLKIQGKKGFARVKRLR